jgi:hypothetical protein
MPNAARIWRSTRPTEGTGQPGSAAEIPAALAANARTGGVLEVCSRFSLSAIVRQSSDLEPNDERTQRPTLPWPRQLTDDAVGRQQKAPSAKHWGPFFVNSACSAGLIPSCPGWRLCRLPAPSRRFSSPVARRCLGIQPSQVTGLAGNGHSDHCGPSGVLIDRATKSQNQLLTDRSLRRTRHSEGVGSTATAAGHKLPPRHRVTDGKALNNQCKGHRWSRHRLSIQVFDTPAAVGGWGPLATKEPRATLTGSQTQPFEQLKYSCQQNVSR